MKTILLIHGANLNLLGKRDSFHYSELTLEELENLIKKEARSYNFKIKTFQSNHEGVLIDYIQKNFSEADGIIINPGAFTHYSYALHDALLDTCLPAVEVHLSNIKKRENWRRKSVIASACIAQINGKKSKGYIEAINLLAKYRKEKYERQL